MELHEKIKKLRVEQRINQIELAQKIGLSRSGYILIENGTTKSIGIDVGMKLADAFGVSFNELFDIDKKENDSMQLELDTLKIELAQEKKEKSYHKKQHEELYSIKLIAEIFPYLDNDLFAACFPEIVNGKNTQTYNIECAASFYYLKGDSSTGEIIKYTDVEKYANSPDFARVLAQNAGSNAWNREKFISWLKKEQDKIRKSL